MDFGANFNSEYCRAMRTLAFWRDVTVLDFLGRALRRRADHAAVVDYNSMTGERTSISFRELDARSMRIASGLRRLGVTRGDVVSFQLPNWWQVVALHLACVRIGAVSNIIMPVFRERELEFMLGLAESKVFIVPRRFRGHDYTATAASLKQRLPSLRHVLVISGDPGQGFDEALLNSEADNVPREDASGPDDIVQLCYTSGTTGEPKGALVTSNTLISNVIPFVERLHLTEDDVLLMASPLAHQTGFMYGVIASLYLGATLVLQDIWDPAAAAEIIRRESVTYSMGAAAFLCDLTSVAARDPDAFRSFKTFVAAGAPIPRALVRLATDSMGAKILSAWGMTEMGAATLTRPEDPPEKVFEADGVCLHGAEIRVLGIAGNPLSPGEEGRLEIRACSLFAGYLRRPGLGMPGPDGWFDTGDMARIDRDGYVRITGRSKDIIIRGGENIPVVELENLLFEHPDIGDVAVVGMPDERLGERACAFVVLKADGHRSRTDLTLADLNSFLVDRRLAKTYWPERLVVMPSLPRTPTGKVQKFKPRELSQQSGSAVASERSL